MAQEKPREKVLVDKAELQFILDEFYRLRDKWDEFAKQRVTVGAAIMRLEGLLQVRQDPDKTPRRPPSSGEVEAAFTRAQEFSVPPPRTGLTSPQPFKVERVTTKVPTPSPSKSDPQAYRLPELPKPDPKK